jgi:hypothetical protein
LFFWHGGCLSATVPTVFKEENAMSHPERRIAVAKVREPKEDPEGTYLEDDDEKAEREEEDPVEDYDAFFADDCDDFKELRFD